MNASKENARKAKKYIADVAGGSANMKFVQLFIEACERKLPTEAAYVRDQQRRKKVSA